jgi:hypothetical protein
MVADWDVEYTLTTPYGTLILNREADIWPKWVVIATECAAGWQTRVTKANVPQRSGSTLRRRFATGAEVTLVFEAWETVEQPACDATLVEMVEELRGHLWAMLTDSQGASRLVFQQPGVAARMFDDVQLLTEAKHSVIDNVRHRVTFTLDTPFPYAMDETQDTVTVDTTTAVVTNNGNVDFWPVIKVYGPFTDFVISNDDLGVAIIYDETLPGAPNISGVQYIEIDCFRDTAYVDGDQANAMPGIVMLSTDFFPLQPGANTITTDVEAEFLVNHPHG